MAAISELFQQIDRIALECINSDWDGYDADRVTSETIEAAKKFVSLLPSKYLENIDVAPDSDGDISFDWWLTARNIFSVSINSKESLAYAGLYGTETVRGHCVFSETIPEIIFLCIDKIYGV